MGILTDLPPIPCAGLCVCLSVCLCARKMYCGKMADWIRMPFGVVSGVGLGMGVLYFGGARRRGRGSVGGEFAASVMCIVAKRLIGSGCRLGW